MRVRVSMVAWTYTPFLDTCASDVANAKSFNQFIMTYSTVSAMSHVYWTHTRAVKLSQRYDDWIPTNSPNTVRWPGRNGTRVQLSTSRHSTICCFITQVHITAVYRHHMPSRISEQYESHQNSVYWLVFTLSDNNDNDMFSFWFSWQQPSSSHFSLWHRLLYIETRKPTSVNDKLTRPYLRINIEQEVKLT